MFTGLAARHRSQPQRARSLPALVDLHRLGSQPGPHRRDGRHLRRSAAHPVPRSRPHASGCPGREAPDGETPSASPTEPVIVGVDLGDDADAAMWTSRVRRGVLRRAPAGQAPSRPPARLRRLVDLRVRRGQPGHPGPGDPLGHRHRPRRPRLVAHQPGRPLLQQPAPVERRGLHGLHGHPPVGQVLDGRLAGQAGHDLDHRRGGVRGLGRRVLHRLPVPAELRLPVDLDQRQGRLQRRRRRRLLQPHELRPDADVAHRADPDRAGRPGRGPRAGRAGPRGGPPAPGPPSPRAGRRGGRRPWPTRPSGGARPAATTS